MTLAPGAAGQLVVFRLDGQFFAVELGRVDRVVPMVALAPFPRAPDVVPGVFNLQGDMIPVVDLRVRFRRARRPPSVDDQLLVVRTRTRRLALAVDHVERVEAGPRQAEKRADSLVPGLEHVRGVVQLADTGVVFLYDLDASLSLDEEAQLARAEEEA